MGWLFGYSSMAELHAELLSNRGGYEILDSAKTKYGRNLWVVMKHPNGEVFIALYLCAKSGNRYGYKDLSESEGPYEVDCPLRFLDMVPMAKGEHAAKWREWVRQHHASKSVKYPVGAEVKIYGKPYKVIGTVKRSYRVQNMETGLVYKCGASKMEAA